MPNPGGQMDKPPAPHTMEMYFTIPINVDIYVFFNNEHNDSKRVLKKSSSNM